MEVNILIIWSSFSVQSLMSWKLCIFSLFVYGSDLGNVIAEISSGEVVCFIFRCCSPKELLALC